MQGISCAEKERIEKIGGDSFTSVPMYQLTKTAPKNMIVPVRSMSHNL